MMHPGVTNTNMITVFSSSTPGLLETSAVINPDSPSSDPDYYILTVKVKDGGSPELTGTATVYVTVTTSNDHTPVFGTTVPTGTISVGWMLLLCLSWERK